MATVLSGASLMGSLGVLTRGWEPRADCVLATEPGRSWHPQHELEAGSLGGGTWISPSNAAGAHTLPQLVMFFRRAQTSISARRGPRATLKGGECRKS